MKSTKNRQRAALSAVVEALPPHGVFTTFAYVHARWTPPAHPLQSSMRPRFDEVVVGRTVWADLPPALVYYCRRPTPASGLPVSAGTADDGPVGRRTLASTDRGSVCNGPLTGPGRAWDHAAWSPN
jgi:hypothetical protein